MIATGGRTEGGATLVEAAFALPIFFILFLGLIDFGLLAFNSNQVANAARDGARVGILQYEEADVDGSADNQRIRDAILAKLPSQSLQTLDVACVAADGTEVECQNLADPDGDANPEKDFLQVRVEWDYGFLSPIANALGFNTMTVSGEARMALIGKPDGVTTPLTTTTLAPCVVSSITVSPGIEADPVLVKSNGQLDEDFTITVTTNGSPLCSAALALEVRGPQYEDDNSDRRIFPAECACSPNFVYRRTSDNFWEDAEDRQGLVIVRHLLGPEVSAPIFLSQP